MSEELKKHLQEVTRSCRIRPVEYWNTRGILSYGSAPLPAAGVSVTLLKGPHGADVHEEER